MLGRRNRKVAIMGYLVLEGFHKWKLDCHIFVTTLIASFVGSFVKNEKKKIWIFVGTTCTWKILPTLGKWNPCYYEIYGTA